MKHLQTISLVLILIIYAIPALCLAESTAVTEPAAVKALMLRKGVAPDSVAKLVELIVENKRDLAAGKVSAALTIEVEDIPPIKDEKGLSAIIPGAEYMPEIAPLPELTRENFVAMVEKLFNTEDVGSWLRNDDGTIPTDEEMKKYVSWRKSDESDMKGAMDKLDKKFGKEAVTEWFDLFNKVQLLRRYEHGNCIESF